MKELEFFKYLYDNTVNGNIKWVVSSKFDDENNYLINQVTNLKYGNIELQKRLYFIGKVCSSYRSYEIRDIVNDIFDFVCSREKLLDESYDIIEEQIKRNKDNE